jgi:adenylate cyclase
VAQGRVFVDRGIADRNRGSREGVAATETRRLAAILAADVAGYSRLMGADEEGTLQRLRAHRRELVDPKIREHRGRIVKTTGDGMLVEFSSVVDAVRCAVEIQRAMVDRNAGIAEDQRIIFRIGVNLGDVIIDGDDIYGDGVNIAARLEALAEPGGVCISRTVRDHVGDRLPFAFDDMGGQSVKNIARPVHAFAMSAAAVAALPEVTTPAQPGALRRRGFARPAVIAAGLVAVIGIGSAIWWAWPKGNPSAVPVQAPAAASAQRPPVPEAEPAPRLSMVVLPFANLSNDPEQEYFADGITDDLTTDLSQIPDSLVIARNTAFTYKGRPTDAKQIGRDLGVRYVVEGSVRRTGDQVQVNVQLIDAESGAHLWAERFDTDRRELANAQDDITFRLVRTLNVKLVAAEVARSEQRKAVDPDARDFVMRGRDWSSRPMSPTTMKEARQAFERALEIDPRSNDARIGLALNLAGTVSIAAAGSVSQDIARAEQLAAEAIARDPTSSTAHEAMGRVRLAQKNRLREAQIEFETALALDRSNINAVRQLGWAAYNLGEPEACIPHGEKGLRLSPRGPGAWNWLALLGNCHLSANHVDLATDYLIKARAAAPQIWWLHLHLAGALGLKGDLDGGRASLAESLRLKQRSIRSPIFVTLDRGTAARNAWNWKSIP